MLNVQTMESKIRKKPAGKLNSMDLMLKLVLQKTLEFLASMCSGDRDFLTGDY